MAEKKNTREERGRNKRKALPSKTLTLGNKRPRNKGRKEEKIRRKTGPRLPSAFRKEIGFTNRVPGNPEDEVDSEGGEGERGELYEYEEEVPQEETKKNRRFDPVDNLEYELPEEFEDEDVPSDDDDGSDKDLTDQSDGGEEEDGDKHLRMLQGITGMPELAFQGKKTREIVSDLPIIDSANGPISIHDLLDPLQDKPEYSKLRKKLEKLEKKPMIVQPPLPKVERERLERKVAYEHSKKDMTKWEPLVKRNREAPTIYFEEDVDVGFSTVGAIAAEFKPRTEFEKKMALLVHDPKVVDAHMKDGSRLLELNKISVDDLMDHQNRLAKMRSLLFRHEMKAKRIKKIKSKTYHRFLRKDKLKVTPSEMQMDPEALKEQTMKQEFKRAEERMTLKHKNSSQWAKRILKRGLQVQDENTKAAMSEQLHQHALLSRKMNSMKDNSSSDDDSDDDELSPRADTERVSKILERAKEKTLSVIEEADEMPKSGVLSLPFMVRGLKKKMEAAHEEARVTLQEYDSSLRQLDDLNEEESPKIHRPSGRKVFGAARKQPQESSKKIESDNIGEGSDSEDDIEIKSNVDVMRKENNQSQEVQLGPGPLFMESDTGEDTVFQTFDDITKYPGPKTTYDVAIFASGSWKKMKDENDANPSSTNPFKAADPALPLQHLKAADQYSDTDSDQEMVDGILSLGNKPDYELPSQDDLIRLAFAGDDVEGEFEKDKLEVLDEENPEPEKPVLLPGWGQWTHVQQKKGLPCWMVKEHEDAKTKREEALKKRKDAHLKNVIISEKIDKKAEKLHTKTLPYPFTSKEVFEQSIRMPIGPEYNPAIAVGALNRPSVIKKAGIIVKPIKFEEVDPYEKADEPKCGEPKPKTKKGKFTGRKTSKKASTGRKI